VSWLTTKHYGRLTKEEAKAELEHLLNHSENEEEFQQECRHRFGGPMMNINWTSSFRSASICFSQGGSNMNVSTSVTIKPFGELTEEEATTIVREIVKAAKSVDAIRNCLTTRGFDGRAALIAPVYEPMFTALVQVWGPRGEVITV